MFRTNARPSIRSPLLALIVIFAVVAALGLAIARAETPTPTPKPSIAFTKLGTQDPTATYVEFNLQVTNTSNPSIASNVITLDDPLPVPGTAWYLAESSGFQCDPLVPPLYLLHCTTGSLLGRHLNNSQTDFVYGTAYVIVRGIRLTCGPVTNTAIITGSDFVGAKSATATASGIPCATVTPPTPIPTATPPTIVPVATPTPVIVYVEVTPTPTKPAIAPKPPNTGNTQESSDSANYGVLMIVAVTSLAFILLGIAWASKRHHQRR